MDFCYALNALREGKKVSRSGWNGKGMWIVYVRGSGGDDGPMVSFGDWLLNEVIFPRSIERLPFIAMKTADDKVVPWLASQTDILATDWGIVA